MIEIIGLSVGMPLLFVVMMAGPAALLGGRLKLKAIEQLVIGLAGALIIFGLCLLAGAAVGGFGVVVWTLVALGAMGTLQQRVRLVQWAIDPTIRSAFVGWMLLLFVVTFYNWSIVTFSGGMWSGDWLEHYERSRVPLFGIDPSQVLFIGFIPYPARPPMVNLLCGMLMRVFGDGFHVYQFASTLIGTLAFWGSALFVRSGDVGVWARRIRLLAAVFCLNPLVMQNLTYPWTKMATGFFVVCGLFVYREWVKRRDDVLLGVSVGLWAGASTCHYSAMVAAVFPAAHMLWMLLARRLMSRRVALSIVAGALPFVVWIAICLMQFGWLKTFATNSSVADRDLTKPAIWFFNFCQNVWASVVPFWFRPLELYPLFVPFQSWVELGFALRNRFFLVYQTNVTFGMGVVGGIAVWFLMLQAALSKQLGIGQELKIFWAGFVAGIVLIGAFAHSNPDYFGVGQISGQPLILLGLAFVVRNLEQLSRVRRLWGRVLLGVLGAGWFTDLMFGTGLHGFIQACSPVEWRFPPAFDLSPTLWYNWQVKLSVGLRFVGDWVKIENYAVMAFVVGILVVVWARLLVRLNDELRNKVA